MPSRRDRVPPSVSVDTIVGGAGTSDTATDRDTGAVSDLFSGVEIY